MIQAEETKPLRDYINNRQAVLAEWVALRPIFEVCAKDTGYDGGRRLRELWWQQATCGCRTTAESHVKRYFGGSVGAVTTGIRQGWWG